MRMAFQKAELAMFVLFVSRLLLALSNYYLLCSSVAFSVVHCSDISRDDIVPSEMSSLDSDTDSEEYTDEAKAKRRLPIKRNRKRVLTNTKLFYFLQNPRNLLTSESQRSQDQIADKSDYEYQPVHESANSYKAIHIHSAQPVQYHGKSKDEYFWPLLLLTFLPVLFGSLILLPLLISFFTQVLQLLAMMQNTVSNINTTTQATTGRRRRRRHISKFELAYYPYGEEMVNQLANRLSKALLRFDGFNSS